MGLADTVGGDPMKKLLVAGIAAAAFCGAPALAADMAVKAPPPPPAVAPAYNWTGFYVGGEFGGGWATSTTTDVTATGAFPAGFVHPPVNYSGALGGIYGGYNYQIDQFVIGIDGDYEWASLTATSTEAAAKVAASATSSDKISWVSTVTGRAGYAINNWLLFAKGGWAWAGFSVNGQGVTNAGVLVDTFTGSPTHNGWTLGAGVEWGFAAHWSAKLEYDYVGFNIANFNETSTSAAGVVTVERKSATSSLNMVKAGVDYRF
jgi:outer membrane immunogenic protein